MKKAFTLIELLVVISIIGILISILLPSLSGARASARKTTCGTNQRSIIGSLLIYEGDYGTLPLLHGVEGRSENPNTDHYGGPVIWGPSSASGFSGIPLSTVPANTNIYLGMGQLLPNNYIALKSFYCPQYQNNEYKGDDQGVARAYFKRLWLVGKPFVAGGTASVLTALQGMPEYDGKGWIDTTLFVRSDYHYRGGDWSYTPNLGSTAGVLKTGAKYLKSSAEEVGGGFNVRAITADWRYWNHGSPDYVQNVGRGDGSVIQVPLARINQALATEVAAGSITAIDAANYPFRWVSNNSTYTPRYPQPSTTRSGIVSTSSEIYLEKIEQVINKY